MIIKHIDGRFMYTQAKEELAKVGDGYRLPSTEDVKNIKQSQTKGEYWIESDHLGGDELYAQMDMGDTTVVREHKGRLKKSVLLVK